MLRHAADALPMLLEEGSDVSYLANLLLTTPCLGWCCLLGPGSSKDGLSAYCPSQMKNTSRIS